MRIAILFALVLSFSMNAQVPDYFADNPEWRQSYTCVDGGNISMYQYVFYIGNDTTVWSNNTGVTTYKQLRWRGIYSYEAFGTYSQNYFDNLFDLVRQDSMRIYKYHGGNDSLYYDFQLNVGDYLPLNPDHLSSTAIVDSIETVTINGTPRKKFYISDNSGLLNATHIIEGVGPNTGFLRPMEQSLNCGNLFFCYRVNGVEEIGSNCNFDLSTEELLLASEVSIHPNPVTDVFTVNFPSQNKISEIQIIAMNGTRSSLSFTQEIEGRIQANLSNIESGAYVLSISFENGYTIAKKLFHQ